LIERLRPWAARVMYRIFLDWLRRAHRSPVTFVGRSGATGELLGEDDDFDEAGDETWNPSVLAEQAFERERITAAWRRLHEQHRVVLSLHEIEGYSLEEVAQIVDVPVGTVKSRMNRARNRLRELLSEGTESSPPTCSPPERPDERKT
jgi:RNA polymerase sigma-70 factor (ECF subfamily)